MRNLTLKFVLTAVLGWSLAFAAEAQTLRGGVKDANNQPVIGAAVVVEGTSLGTSTGVDGSFTLNVPDTKTNVLVVSYIGMKTQRIPVNGRTTIEIVMADDATALEDVVVIGYQTIRRKDLTGSVASVSAKEITSAPVANVAQALQGKLPGVNVTSQDGRPDAEVSIRVRGGGSISQSNEPLVLIDGVSGSLSDVPADQIESIDVLKDASSTAIYGARGANGVILVTTKGAAEGRVSVTYNGYAKFNTPTKYLDALNPYDYLAWTWGNATANGAAYVEPFVRAFGLENGGIEKYRNVPTYNMQKEVYNESLSHNHDITVSGGTDKTKLLFSFNHMDEDGMKLNSYFKRSNVSVKLNQKLAKGLDVALDTRYVEVEKMGNEGTTNGSGSLLSYAYRFRPIATEHMANPDALREGNIEQYGRFSMWDTYSPVARIGDYEPLQQRQHLRATASLNWQIIEGLVYHTDLTMARSWQQNKTWSGAIYNQYLDDATGEALYAGNAELYKADSWSMRWTNTLSYNVTIADKHRLNVLAGHEVTNSNGDSMRISASYFPSNFSKANAFAMINQYSDKGAAAFSSAANTPGRLLSFFGRLNYSFDDRYLLTFTMRADGSSNFAPSKQWGYFPAAAAAWRVSEEKFMEGTKHWLDNLKLRVSYGQVGSDGISSNLWASTWSAQSDTRYQYVIDNTYTPAYQYSSSHMANPDLKWETTITRNIGIDFGLWNGRLTGTVDAYWNSTKDLLMATTIPGISGFTSTYANIGETSNKGIEVALQGVIVDKKDLRVTAGFNINFNKNNVESLAPNVTGLYGTQWASSATFPAKDYVLLEGQPVGLVRGLIYDGYYTVDDFDYDNGTYILKDGIADMTTDVMPNFHGLTTGDGKDRPTGQMAYPGMAKYRDLNDDGKISEEDVDVIGDMNPDFTGGFNINVQWKNFDFGAYFNYSVGNKIYNANKLASLYGYKETGVYENKLDVINQSFKIYDVQNGNLVRLQTPDQLRAANQGAIYPLAYNENGIVSTMGIEDGSYLRLNTLTLGYTLPKHITKKVGISNLRVYGSIYNVFTLTDYSGLDPEVNTNTKQNNQIYPTVGLDWGSYPRARSFVVGLNLAF